EQLKLKGPAPFTPSGGTCQIDAHCARPANTAQCGPTAVCAANELCVDPADGGQTCKTDVNCPGSATTGEQMVCSGGAACVELCGTSDRCPIPTPIPAGGGVINGDNTGGTAVLEGCFNSGSSRERTFTWTPSTSGTATISTCGGATYDTVVYIIQGTDCHAAVLACDDDTCSTQSTITPTVTAGVTYT